METHARNLIKDTLSRPENLIKVNQLLEINKGAKLCPFASIVCQHFDFKDYEGKLQTTNCAQALLAMDTQRLISLHGFIDYKPYDPRENHAKPICLETDVPTPTNVPESVEEMDDLRLILVNTDELRTIWNTLMEKEHPLGVGRPVGHQLFYLIHSKHGWLGGLSFVSAALSLEDREKFIGWTEDQRLEHLDRVINMGRFLIRNSAVHCKNLESKVLSMSMEAVQQDFHAKYNFSPYLVETFVDPAHSTGECYQAANWLEVGTTKGRGRNDRYNDTYKSKKSIFIYPLVPDFRERMGIDPAAAGSLDRTPEYYRTPVEITEHMGVDEWAEFEFGSCQLGHARRTKRVVRIADTMARQPTQSFNSAAKGNHTEIEGYYNFLENKAKDINEDSLLQGHKQRTIQRTLGRPIVLCVQDETTFNFTSLAKCEGLRNISKNQTGTSAKGVIAHTTQVIDPEQNVTLGLLNVSFPAEIKKDPADRRTSYEIPLDEKKTHSWVLHTQTVDEVAQNVPDTTFVMVGDRENDFFEYFVEFDKMDNAKENLHALVRVQNNRSIEGENLRLFNSLEQAEEAGQITITVPRQSERPKLSKKKSKKKRKKRTATLSIRYRTVVVKPPSQMKDAQPITLQAIYAVEVNPPADDSPVSWRLLTTLPVQSFEDAVQCVTFYTKRWKIEEFHRVLKSGCGAETLTNRTSEALKRAILIKMVIAWRITLLLQLGRNVPGLPIEECFDDLEVEVLRTFAANTNHPLNNLKDAILLIAILGGFMGRKGDLPPGYEVFWRGYEKLQTMRLAHQLGRIKSAALGGEDPPP